MCLGSFLSMFFFPLRLDLASRASLAKKSLCRRCGLARHVLEFEDHSGMYSAGSRQPSFCLNELAGMSSSEPDKYGLLLSIQF